MNRKHLLPRENDVNTLQHSLPFFRLLDPHSSKEAGTGPWCPLHSSVLPCHHDILTSAINLIETNLPISRHQTSHCSLVGPSPHTTPIQFKPHDHDENF
jgi:hypothetical protein